MLGYEQTDVSIRPFSIWWCQTCSSPLYKYNILLLLYGYYAYEYSSTISVALNVSSVQWMPIIKASS